MTDLHVFVFGLAAIIVAGGILVAISDAIEQALEWRLEQRIRADARRGPWAPR